MEKKKHAEERKHGRGAGKEEEEEEEAHPLDYTGDHEHRLLSSILSLCVCVLYGEGCYPLCVMCCYPL